MKFILMGLTIGGFLALVSGTAHAYGTPTVLDTTFNTSNFSGQVNTATTLKAVAAPCPFRSRVGIADNTNPSVDRFGNRISTVNGNH